MDSVVCLTRGAMPSAAMAEHALSTPPPEISLASSPERDARSLLDRLAPKEPEQITEESDGGGGWGGWFSSIITEASKKTTDMIAESGKRLETLTAEVVSAVEVVSEKALPVLGDLERWAGLDDSRVSGDGREAGFDVFYLTNGGRELTASLKALSRKCDATLASMKVDGVKFDSARRIASTSRGQTAHKDDDEDEEKAPGAMLVHAPRCDRGANAATLCRLCRWLARRGGH